MCLCKGQRDYTCVPADKVTRRPYGSVYDNVTKMFVVFSRTQAYHAYHSSEGAVHTTTLDHVYVNISLYIHIVSKCNM